MTYDDLPHVSETSDVLPDVVRRLQASDRDAFARMYQATHLGLLRYAWRFTGDTQAAADVVQDVFVKLWHVRETLDPARSVKSLLYTMTRNLALNHTRAVQSHATPVAEVDHWDDVDAPDAERAYDADLLARHLDRHRTRLQRLRRRGDRHRDGPHTPYRQYAHRTCPQIPSSAPPGAGRGQSTIDMKLVPSTPGPRRRVPLPPEAAAEFDTPAERSAAAEVWQMAGLLARREPSDEALSALSHDLWSRIDAETRPDAAPARPALRLVPPWLGRTLALAAAVALLIAAGLGLYLRPLELSAPTGSVATYELPDGSVVTLNSRSTLTYHRPLLRGERLARLDGEAFFDVATSGTPFVVETFNAHVRVLGTRFNVEAWSADEAAYTEVVLEEGRIALAPRGAAGDAVVLAPGEHSRIGAAQRVSAPAPLDPAPVLAWRSGRLSFEEVPLQEIFRELEHRFGIEIQASDPALLDRPQTLSVGPRPTAEAYLEDLASNGVFRYQRTADGFLISPTE